MHLSTSKIKANLEQVDPNVKVSRKTISNRLKDNDLSAKRPRKVPLKSRKNLRDRVRIGKKFKDLDVTKHLDRKFLER